MTSESLRERVKRLIVESGLSHPEIESRGGMPKNAVADLLRNLKVNSNMTTRTAERLARGLGVTADAILFGEDASINEARLLAVFRELDDHQRNLVLQLGETLRDAARHKEDTPDRQA